MATPSFNSASSSRGRRGSRIAAATRITSKISLASLLSLALVLLVTTNSLLTAEASPYIIADDRVRNLDTTPVLGRGYSIMTDRYHSTCLMVNVTTVPSYNYEYNFQEFIFDAEDSASTLTGTHIENSFAYNEVRESVIKTDNSTASSSRKVQIEEHHIVATMRIERYYSSVREEVSPLSDDALELLNRQDFIGFFKACGPAYIRSIRRAQEVTAIFTFQSTSQEIARQFAETMKSASWDENSGGTSDLAASKFDAINKSLKIEIRGYGLGLNVQGSSTLYASSLKEYHNVMEFAFRSMTQAENSYKIGMVYGIEVVPWTDNAVFQVASGVINTDVLLPVTRNLIPKATNNGTKCKNQFYVIDKFGYCCEPSSLYNITSQAYDFDESDKSDEFVCRPLRKLEKALIKENMAANGEFVARLDSALRSKVATLSLVEKCISAAAAIPDRYDNYIIKAKDNTDYNDEIDGKVSLIDLKLTLDPLGDYGLVRHLAKELDEYIDMFYSPCLAAMFGTNIGSTSDVEAKYFMAKPWHTHEECSRLSCLVDNMRWDREKGGCVPGMLSGMKAAGYNGTDSMCSYDEDSYETEECKYQTTELKEYYESATRCWEKLPRYSVTYLMGHFCLPTITGKEVDSSTKVYNNETLATCRPSE